MSVSVFGLKFLSNVVFDSRARTRRSRPRHLNIRIFNYISFVTVTKDRGVCVCVPKISKEYHRDP